MPDQKAVTVPLLFVGAEELPILYANHFVIQYERDAFILTVGQLSPPILIGNESEQREQLEALSYVEVKTVARLAFTRGRLDELIGILQANLRAFDAMTVEQRDE